MNRILIAYLAGAATITAFTVATGGMNLTMFVLGAATAAVAMGLACRAIGARRLIVLLTRIFADQPAAARAREPGASVTAMPLTIVEEEVISALMNLGLRRAHALKALALARPKAAQQFEPLFRATLDLSRAA